MDMAEHDGHCTECHRITMNTNLTVAQKDYAVFLPALSGFYATYVGKQRFPDPVKGLYVDPARIPSNFKNGMESLNWFDPQKGQFEYHWSLYSAGHAELDVNKFSPKEDMVRNRNRATSFILGDSGGFQIGKGVWEGDWKNPNCPKAQKKRELVLTWMDKYMDYGMCLDIPAWVARSPVGRKATGINTYIEAVQGTYINNDWFINNRNGNCKFLNVLQGENHADADDWYQRMKKYCDPKQYPDTHFNGWSMGGQNMCDVHLVLKRLVALRFDGLLEKGVHDWMHFLGTSRLEWATLLTDIQRAVRKYHNSNFTISFDCASPFLATANGQIYIQTEITDREKWVYRMVPSIDDKKYSVDPRGFGAAGVQDGRFKGFQDSPISTGLKVSDVCIYKPGDLNKIGKEGKTSWDSFSYAIQMGHNVWQHINAVQEANRQYDNGLVPAMLVQEKFDRLYIRDIIDAIFATSDRGIADAIVEDYSKFWMGVLGTRGATGKKTINASTQFANLFDVVEEDSVQLEHAEEFSDEEASKLDQLEDDVLNDAT
jgi:hypothetical protein